MLLQVIKNREESLGAGRGSRTPKGRSPADFESAASASSAIPAWIVSCGENKLNRGYRALQPLLKSLRRKLCLLSSQVASAAAL
jgi:hypothetical protein